MLLVNTCKEAKRVGMPFRAFENFTRVIAHVVDACVGDGEAAVCAVQHWISVVQPLVGVGVYRLHREGCIGADGDQLVLRLQQDFWRIPAVPERWVQRGGGLGHSQPKSQWLTRQRRTGFCFSYWVIWVNGGSCLTAQLTYGRFPHIFQQFRCPFLSLFFLRGK